MQVILLLLLLSMNGNGELNETLGKVLTFYRENKPLVEALMNGTLPLGSSKAQESETATQSEAQTESRPQAGGNYSAIEEFLRSSGL